MKKALLALLLLLAPGLAFGQGILASDGVSSTAWVSGQKVLIAIPGALITVCSTPAILVNGACTNTVALYSDTALTQPIPNPTPLDASSNYNFYVANAGLQYSVTNKGVSSGPYFIRTPISSFNPATPGPIGVATPAAVNATAVTAQSVNTSSAPTACVEAFMTTGMTGDYGQAINATVQAQPLLQQSNVSICVPGDHPISTQAVFDRPIHFNMRGARLVPQAALGHPNITLTGVALTSGSQTISMASTTGLAAGYAIGGAGIPPQTQIFSVNSSTQLTLTQAAVSTVSAGTATAVNAQPVMKWIYNVNAFHKIEGTMYGGSMEGVWIEDTGYRSINGLQGIQIYGWDAIPMRNTKLYEIAGSELILGGWTPLGSYYPAMVRESTFVDTALRGGGDLQTGQTALAIQTPYQNATSGADEINQIAFIGGQVVSSYNSAIYVGTNNTAHFAGYNGPRLIWFKSNFQVEDFLYSWQYAPYATNQAYRANFTGGNVPALADAVVMPIAGDIYFEGAEINSIGLGKSMFHLGNVLSLSASNSRLLANGGPVNLTAAVSNGSNQVTLVSGAAGFPINNWWAGQGITINSVNYTIASGTPAALTLSSNYAGTSSSSAALSVFGGGYFLTTDTYVGQLKFSGNTYNDPNPEALSWMGITSSWYNLWPGATSFLCHYADLDYASTSGPAWKFGKQTFVTPGDASYLPSMTELAPNLATGHFVQHFLGHSLSNNNSVEEEFYYGAEGSADNFVQWRLYGQLNSMIFTGNGVLSVPSILIGGGTAVSGTTGLGTKLPTASTMGTSLPVCTDVNSTLTTSGCVLPTGYTGTVTCTAGQHINALTVVNGSITVAPTCN